jgi:hypothetical protein
MAKAAWSADHGLLLPRAGTLTVYRFGYPARLPDGRVLCSHLS